MNRLASLTLVLCLGVISAGYIHGSAEKRFEGKNWRDVLKEVPCDLVSRDGQEFKIKAILVVGSNTLTDPTISEEGQIKEIEHNCPKL